MHETIHEISHETIDNVLEFWFGPDASSTPATGIADKQSSLWWSKNPSIDQEITHRFATTTGAAVKGELDHWAASPRGLLALIILTDQFPRNMYRDTPEAFSCDPVALSFARQCVASAAAQQLRPIERVFAYLPFEHSEEFTDQQESVALYQALLESLADSATPEELELFNNSCDFARRHQEIIERFGRFPHRNRILGRHSTDEEVAFLKQPGSSF